MAKKGTKTQVLEINPQNPQPRLIRKVVDLLKEGGVIIYPTDTVYGIGCDLMNKRATERIYQIKQRRPDKPFSFICADLSDISQYAKVSNYAYKTMKRLLPGPYTFVLDGASLTPKMAMTRQKTVGIRVPDNEICLAVVQGLGNPVISTSATTEEDGRVPPDPYLLEEQFRGRVDLVVDGGYLLSEPSSVISLVGAEPEVLRAGQGDISEFQ